mmetsp:Transcript_4274/g.8167  ORF Transcript_4274/g.8167 Transcript_4274/m.8167 type:complete len:201 (-) Transcript_4274:900-1502(-)
MQLPAQSQKRLCKQQICRTQHQAHAYCRTQQLQLQRQVVSNSLLQDLEQRSQSCKLGGGVRIQAVLRGDPLLAVLFRAIMMVVVLVMLLLAIMCILAILCFQFFLFPFFFLTLALFFFVHTPQQLSGTLTLRLVLQIKVCFAARGGRRGVVPWKMFHEVLIDREHFVGSESNHAPNMVDEELDQFRRDFDLGSQKLDIFE